ncbi:hypothetical protein POM88_030084 [Heracleum sosnowskyi]|uniref:HTH myb-type domain-containing protein n=1 Tax=Heracleum sosnowskyi TaxID=360622 RepID=A0AAD8MHS8_9APIA|nr:hypothetical protein POM88_030084 [Heracleum sosnowskyi]
MNNIFMDLQRINDPYERISKLKSYVSRLSTEMVVINSLKGDISLSVSMLNDAIKKLNSMIADSSKMNEELTIKEFIYVDGKNLKDGGGMSKSNIDDGDRKNWMLDVKLWNAQDPKSDDDGLVEEKKACENPNNQIIWKFDKSEGSSGLFRTPTSLAIQESSDQIPPYVSEQRDDSVTLINPQVTPYVNDPSRKKRRRHWSEALHDHFVQAIRHLGPAKATPKRIKDQMKMDDLTIDEIKSHLQKYKSRHHCQLGKASTSAVPSSPANSGISEGPSGNNSGWGGADNEGGYKYKFQI